METKIELTEAELKMIQLKREQDELKAKEAEIQKAIKREKEIAGIKIRINAFKAELDRDKAAVYNFANQLNECSPGKYEVEEKQYDKDFELSDFIYKEDGKIDWDKKDVYFKEIIPAIRYTIKRGTIELFIEYRDREYKLYYNYKYYKVAKTVDQKINEVFAKQDREKKLQEAKATAKETVLAILKEKYPNTTIEHRQDYHSGYRGYRTNSPGYYTEHYKVTFQNGLTIDFQYWENGTIGKGVIGGFDKFEFDEVVEILSKMKQIEAK